ncbi:hypothetical protein L3Y25_gp121 [Gordonia phage Syleon]|uniref:Uncharacterized protein n=2 Tax=Octobienvirus TaxID=3044779 RepID=A0AAE8Y688_9CAUD|nr:hypothetical protein L3Y24_gp124 [Gordonia phage Kudefre]YP_010246773.1 hypothetical protein L3Y25_gp121 [Gordonia phage Syleon]QGH75843.1 hypothetical protein SEA_SYLEON_120 [Gordonia phage Syleon]UDL15337.1 hypothetical protein SEA_KUDEFRE_119 [Gordonia phage Kudefre]
MICTLNVVDDSELTPDGNGRYSTVVPIDGRLAAELFEFPDAPLMAFEMVGNLRHVYMLDTFMVFKDEAHVAQMRVTFKRFLSGEVSP